MIANDDHRNNHGTVTSIRGSVVDARFPTRLPPIYRQLVVHDPPIVVEVVTQLDEQTVRGVALTPTRGLARGADIVDTGEMIQVPVGERVLGRVFNVFGEPIDEQGALDKGTEWPIHPPGVPLGEEITREGRICL
jgi:F-type H+-transporting ATPase subunit beta